MLTVIVSMGGMLLLSFIIAYLFGREYADGTAKNLLALPVGRHWFVLAKLVVAALWWFALVAAVLAEGLVIGLVLRLSDFSTGLVLSGSGNALVAAGIAYLLAPVIAWITTLGRGTCRRSASHSRCSPSATCSPRPAGRSGSLGRSSRCPSG